MARRSAQGAVRMHLSPEDVGARIRAARLSRGWTHEELARRMDANWRTVQRWQKGDLPRLKTLLRLADVLGVPRGYFVEPEDPVATVDDLRERVDALTARVEELTRALAALEQSRLEQGQADDRRRSAPSAR